MATRLTQQIVDKHAAKAKPGIEPYDVIDAGCPGLILRVKPRGASWGLKFERSGSTIRMKFGTPGVLDLEQARHIAGKARAMVHSSAATPGEEWLRDRYVELGLALARPVRDPVLVAEFAAAMPHLLSWRWEEARESYLDEVKRTRRPDTWNDYRTMLHQKELSVLAGRQVRGITRGELAVIVDRVFTSGRERHAEHLASVLRPMWNYLATDRRQHLSGVTSTMAGLKAPERSSGTKPRANGKIPGTFIAPADEVGFLVAAARAGALDRSLALSMELLVITSQRRRPISSALIEDFVPYVEEPGWGVWSMGPAHRKTADRRQDKHRHCVPLPPALWERVQEQAARARAAGSPYLFPQHRARRAGGPTDGHMSPAAINHRLLDMGLRSSPHDIRRAFSNTCQTRYRISRPDTKLVMDHNEGIRSDDVLEGHYTADDRLDLKKPVVQVWWDHVEGLSGSTVLPDLTTLRADISRRRREREAAGKAKTAALKAAKEAEEKAMEVQAA